MDNGAIVLVEDDPDDVVLTQRALEKSRIRNELIVLRDGAEALEYLFGTGQYAGRDPGEAPALVLLDLKLPKVPGMEVLRQIRSDPRTRLYPVVILTSSMQETDLLNGYARGANSYICKPVDFEQFVKIVGHLGLYWLVHNEPPPRKRRAHASRAR